MVNKLIFAGLAIVLIIVTALVQGHWTNRWNDNSSERIGQFAEAFDRVPLQVFAGDKEWNGKEPEENAKKKARIEQRAGAAKIRTLSYQDLESGEQITVLMVCGPSRDVSNHTPDACYVSQGYKMTPPIKRFKIGDGEFFTATFRKGNRNLRIFWAWNPEGKFEVHGGDPRNVYGGRTPLNKVYLINEIPAEGQKTERSPCVEFGQKFTQEFNRTVFGQEPSSESDGDA